LLSIIFIHILYFIQKSLSRECSTCLYYLDKEKTASGNLSLIIFSEDYILVFIQQLLYRRLFNIIDSLPVMAQNSIYVLPLHTIISIKIIAFLEKVFEDIYWKINI